MVVHRIGSSSMLFMSKGKYIDNHTFNRYFRDQPLTHLDVTDQHFQLWYFEDWLKKYFFAIIQLLEVGLFIFDSDFTTLIVYLSFLRLSLSTRYRMFVRRP